MSEVRASLVSPTGVELVDSVAHLAFTHAADALGRKLLAALGKQEGVLLLSVEPNRSYDIQFEYQSSREVDDHQAERRIRYSGRT